MTYNFEQSENQEAPQEVSQQAPSLTWDLIREQRDNMLLAAEKFYNFDSPDSVKAVWTAYKQELRDIPQKYADLEDLTQIEWPTLPTSHLQTLNLSRYGIH